MGTKSSRSAHAVAAERAVLAEMGVIHDPYACTMLTPLMRAIYEVGRRWPHRIPTLRVTLAGLAARVRWHDEQVSKAIAAGIRQVAVIGAGFDSRAWRLARDRVQFFELDHPATQQDKIRRAPGPGPTYVAADLITDSAAEALQHGGFDATQPALFILEGVTMYLPEKVVRRQLVGLAELSASGSRLTTDFYPPAETASTTGEQRQNRMQRLARSGSGETLRLVVDRAAAVRLVETSGGWVVDDVCGGREAARTLVPSESGLPVDAVSDDKTVLSAMLP